MKKKYIQNVLAADSSGEIAYICGKCGKEINKEDSICKHCGARLGDIKCPFCNFKGSVKDFNRDTCPRCGRKNSNLPGKKGAGSSREGTEYGLPQIPAKYFWLLFMGLVVINVLLVLFFLYFFDLL